jgi:hypothetical protein
VISKRAISYVHDSRNLSALDGLGSFRFQMAGSPFNRELRTRLNQEKVGSLPPDIREQYSSENGAMIDEGIKALQQAMSLRL